MCAIIGMLGGMPSREKFKKARDTMTHRGPDDAGLYYHPEEGVALGHRRLSIIDLSRAGRQPFSSDCGNFHIVFNGEIYNYKELRKELSSSYRFKTKTDTEVLVAAYKRWGVRSLSRLRGMFAFALWDKEKRSLLVARDRLGIKPLYYRAAKDNFCFSSEIKGILAVTDVPRAMNTRSILDYLSYRYPLGESTFFKGIDSLLPGHYLIIKQGTRPRRFRYWELSVITEKQDPGEEAVLRTTEQLLKETVASHMVSDVPVGAYLSGGIDSSLLVAIMAAHSSKPVKTFAVGFEEKEFNEFSYARLVAKKIKSEHHELLMNGNEYLNLLPSVIRFKDAPLHVPNEVPLYALSRELKKYITVVLSGEGADELFGGYGRLFRSGDDFLRMCNLATDTEKTLHRNLHARYGANFPKTIVAHVLRHYPYTRAGETKSLLNPDIFNLTERDILNEKFFEEEFSSVSTLHPSEQIIHFFQRVHLLGILHRLDTATMGASVEGRAPYIDHALVEYISALPLRYKMRWKSEKDRRRARFLNAEQISDIHDTTKYLLRTLAAPFLPEKIIQRAKKGFPVPLDRWLGGKLNVAAKELLLSQSALSRQLYNQKVLREWLSYSYTSSGLPRGRNIWALLNIELWMQEYRITL